jgi:hypothetical protein
MPLMIPPIGRRGKPLGVGFDVALSRAAIPPAFPDQEPAVILGLNRGDGEWSATQVMRLLERISS